MIADYGLGNCRALLLVYYPFGQAPVAPYPFVDLLTETLQVSGSTRSCSGSQYFCPNFFTEVEAKMERRLKEAHLHNEI